MNNSLTLVIWKCVFDRIVYIVKKGMNSFCGRHNVAKKMVCPLHKYSRTPLVRLINLDKCKIVLQEGCPFPEGRRGGDT